MPHVAVRPAVSPRRLVLFAIAVSLAMTAASLTDPSGVRRLRRLDADIARQEALDRALREENARLRRAVKELSPPIDPAALERVAREQLGWVKQDEVLFQFQ